MGDTHLLFVSGMAAGAMLVPHNAIRPSGIE